MRRHPFVIVMAAAVMTVGLVGPDLASSAPTGDPRAEREKVRAEQAEVAAKIDTTKASKQEIDDAIEVINENLATQEAALARTQEQVAEAKQDVADAEEQRRQLAQPRGHAVDAGEVSLVDIARSEGLRLATDRIHYFSRWVTPLGAPRRYDTRFFIAHPPEWQNPVHDDHEVIANLWIRPAEALDRHARGEPHRDLRHRHRLQPVEISREQVEQCAERAHHRRDRRWA